MALIKCKNCNKQISDKAKQCIHCGTSILKDNTMQNNENELLKKELEKQKIKLDNENEFLKKELEKQKIKLNNEKELLKKELETEKTKLNNENERLKEELETEKNKIDNEKKVLKKELEKQKIKSSNLQEKLDNKKKEQMDKVINISKKTTTKILNIIRCFIAIFFGIGGLFCLIEGKIFYMIGYLIIGISFIPFIYNVFRRNKSLYTVLQVLVPIIAFIISGIIFTIER